MLDKPIISMGILHQLCSNKPYWLTGICLSLIYFILAKLGLSFTVVSSNITLIWPASGFALFALLVLGKRYWPWLMLAAFVANLTTGISLYACIGIAVGNTLEALTGYYLLRYFCFDNRLSHVRDVLYLAAYAAGISTMVSATIGTLSLVSFGILPWANYYTAWFNWWMGDAMGVLAFTPLLLSWWYKYPLKVTRSHLFELALLLTGVFIITEFVFGFQSYFFEQPLPLAYTTFPFLIWAAMRFGLRGATSATVVIGGVVLINIIFKIGLFGSGSPLQSLILLWLYTNFFSITSMIITAAISERQEAEQSMHYMAVHDYLTGLPNRRSLVDRIEQAIAHAERNHEKFALLFLDIDRFKLINDSLGHSKGDEILVVMSKRLLDCVRNEDTVSRLGGDEFVIMMQSITNADDVYLICKKIISSMRKPIVLDGSEFHCSISMGISLYPNDGSNADMLLKHADIAMYRAKDAGRDNYQFYASEMNKQVEARLSVEGDLRHALENKAFLLHYQPQYHVPDGEIKGCEALIRWQKDDKTCIGPDIFIPILEETGQIKKVGAWVIEEACRQLSVWNEEGFDRIRMSVNVSSYQLNDHEFPQLIDKVLTQYNINPEFFELEITESMLVRQDAVVEDVMQRLVALGLRLAIDDFGTGYSSLSYLHRLSIDTLKVDRSFIENIPGNSNSEAIAKAIVGLAKSLHLEVVAEGVENNDQANFISGLGCDYIQGFLLSKPVTADIFLKMLEVEEKQIVHDILFNRG